ncbi:MAG: hypothetical protein R3E65_02530 [Steroidobacteraceae bacterium]
MRIAKPMLLVSTPIGVVWGVVEAARFHPGLAVLMSGLVSVIAAFFWMTVARIRRERRLLSAVESDGPPRP